MILTSEVLAREIVEFLKPIKSCVFYSQYKISYVFIGNSPSRSPRHPSSKRIAHISITDDLAIKIHYNYQSHKAPLDAFEFDISNPNLFKNIKSKVEEVINANSRNDISRD